MADDPSADSSPAGWRSLFLLSFKARDALATQCAKAGWRVSAARRGEQAAQRFLAANTMIAVVDCRDSPDEALKAIAATAGLYPHGGIAVVAILDAESPDHVAPAVFEAGATQLLDLSARSADLPRALEFAQQMVDSFRTIRERGETVGPQPGPDLPQWRWPIGAAEETTVNAALLSATRGVDRRTYPISHFYRAMSPAERTRARGALGRLREGAGQATIPHRFEGRDVLHQLHRSRHALSGHIEFVSAEGDRGRSRSSLSALRSAAGARAWIEERGAGEQNILLVALGLKNLRVVNAAYGRQRGDAVLRETAARLLAHMKPDGSSIAARLDGEAFLVVVNDCAGDVSMAERLVAACSRSVVLGDLTIPVIARAGVVQATYRSEGRAAHVIRRAALMLAKAMADDSRPIVEATDGDHNLSDSESLESDLIADIQNDRIAVLLQPQFRCDTGQLTGAEALARWDHAEHGRLGAATLFAVAERIGMTTALSAHIRRTALSIAADWPDSLSFLRLSINVTAGDLADPAFATSLADEVRGLNLPTDRLTLEITETDLIRERTRAAALCHDLRRTGIRIAIDDFGTGYSSLSYLNDLPVDYVKIDSQLTATIAQSDREQLVVRSILSLAQDLGLDTIAEGVETETQLARLIEQNCTWYQGFLRAGAMPPAEFVPFALRCN